MGAMDTAANSLSWSNITIWILFFQLKNQVLNEFMDIRKFEVKRLLFLNSKRYLIYCIDKKTISFYPEESN